MKFTLTSDEHRKIPLNMDSINAYASKWVPNTEFEVSVIRRTEKRSDPQRKYYFVEVLAKTTEGLGYEPDENLEVHKALKGTYFSNVIALMEELELDIPYLDDRGIWRKVPSVFGDDSVIPVDEKAKFVDWVIRMASKQHGVYIQGSDGS